MTCGLAIHWHWRRHGPVHMLFAGNVRMGGVQQSPAGKWFAWTSVYGCRMAAGYHHTFQAAQTALLDCVIAALTAEAPHG